MGTTPNVAKDAKHSKARSLDNDPFALPRSIAKQIKSCAEAHERGALFPPDVIKYLWINIMDPGKSGIVPRPMNAKELTWQDWLNVVDEAAALGVECLIICVGESLAQYPGLRQICHWAQEAHSLDIGLHMYGSSLTAAEIDDLASLDPSHTWLFVPEQHVNGIRQSLAAKNIRVLSAGVTYDDHHPPCDMPKTMVYIDSCGKMYTCGLVLNDDRFVLGHVAENPLDRALTAPDASREVPAWVEHREHGCDACPPLMARRMMGHA